MQKYVHLRQLASNCAKYAFNKDIEDITRGHGYYTGAKQYFTNERSE